MSITHQNVMLFSPPYDDFVSITADYDLLQLRGGTLVWYLYDAVLQRSQFEWLLQRPARVPLFIVLPPAEAIEPILSLIPKLNDLHARGVLPNGPLDTTEPVRILLRTPPRDLPATVVTYLTRRGILRDTKARATVTRFFELAPTIPSISGLARRLYTSRRSLGRYFEAQHLPVPSHWLQFARLLYVSTRLQQVDDVPIFRIATQYGYPDGFTMSNQMKRLIGIRPTDVRDNLGWEWIVEEWLKAEGLADRSKPAAEPAQELTNEDGSKPGQ